MLSGGLLLLLLLVLVAAALDVCLSRLVAPSSDAFPDDLPLPPLVVTAVRDAVGVRQQLALLACVTGSQPDEAEMVQSTWRSLVPALNAEARWTLTTRAGCGGEWSAEGAVLVVFGGDVAATLEKLGHPVGQPQPLILLAHRFRLPLDPLVAPSSVSRLLLLEASSGRVSWWAPHPCHGQLEPVPSQSLQLDMQGCPLVASTFVWPPYTLPAQQLHPERDQTAPFVLADESFFKGGLEVRLAETLAARLNATLRYRVRMRDMWRGVVDDVSRRAVHLGFAGKWFVVTEPHLGITCTVPYHRGSFYW